MEVQIKMPDLATTAEEVTIIRWLVEVGSPVRLGEPLLEIETDKAAMDVEAVAAGTLKEVFAAAGDQVSVGQGIGIIDSIGSVSEVHQPATVSTAHVEAAPVAQIPI